MRRGSWLRRLGEGLLTLGLVVLLFVGYELYGTSWLAARDQQEASAALDDDWGSDRPPTGPGAGKPFSRIYLPTFGLDFVRTVLEGVDTRSLAAGPGHYPGTALPGQPGNVAVAGHRVGRGSPFDAAHELRSCDAIVFETRDAWHVYRVLPMADERDDWAQTVARRPECVGVAPLGGAYADTYGREIVAPSEADVVAAVPHHSGLSAADTPVSLVTLTTCHPRFSARQRMIIHGVLVQQYPKRTAEPAWRPPELAPSPTAQG